MSKPLRLILAMLLLALPAAWWGLRTGRSAPPPQPVTAPSPPALPAAPMPQAPTLVPNTLEERLEALAAVEAEGLFPEDEEDSSGPCIAVEVTARGVPVQGAYVKAARDEGEDLYFSLRTLHLGPDGRGQAWCKPGEYLLAAHAPGFAPSILELVVGAADSAPRARFELSAGHSVSGRVLDMDSHEPIVGATLTFAPLENAGFVVEEGSSTSGERGAFLIKGLITGTYRIEARSPGHSPEELFVDVPEQGSATLRLRSQCQLEGQVVDAAGAPVPGARVFTSNDPDERTLTDAQGRFSLAVSEGTWHLAAEAAGLAGVHEGGITVARGGLVDGLVIRLGATGSMAGKVFTLPDRAPVKGAHITLHHAGHGWTRMASTDASGSFRLEHLLPGTYALTAYTPGYPEVALEALHVRAGQELPVEIPLAQPTFLEGSLTDSRGRPAPEATVLLKPLEEGPSASGSLYTTGDEEGHYVIDSVPLGRYQIEARLSEESPPLFREITVGKEGPHRADFTFPEALVELRGTVQRASGGPPLHEVELQISAASGGGHASVSVDTQGHFSTTLAEGAYTLFAWYLDTLEKGPAQHVTLKPDAVSHVRLTVPDGVVETSGVVLDSRGEPAAGASVHLAGDGHHASAEADALGRFTLKTPGSSTGALAELSAESAPEEGRLDAVSMGTRGLLVRLQRAGALRGRAIATRGPPVQGFELYTRRGQGAPLHYPQGDALPFVGDTFEQVDLPPGPYELVACTPDGRCGRVRVQLAPGQTREVELPVGPLGRVRGRSLSARGVPVPGTLVVDLGLERQHVVNTSPDGRFELVVEPGPHSLHFGDGRKHTFHLSEGEALELGALSPREPP